MSSKPLDVNVGLPKSQNLLRIGHVFADRYRILKLLGRGGMGAVYLVHDQEVDSQVAMKVLDSEFAQLPTAIQRFRQEVRLSRQITHRNVTRTFDLGTHKGLFYLTMEYIDGSNLQESICGKRIGVAQMVAIVLQVCSGIEAAHIAGVIHRDLKPENLLVENKTGRIVVTDFGIARRMGAESPMKTVGSIGTPAFMSPEQLLGQAINAKSDIYSLGLIMYQLSTGQLPFTKDSALATAMARLTEQPAAPRTIADEISENISETIMDCLQRDPLVRPELANVVERLQGIEAVTFVPLAPVAYVSLPEEGRRIGLIAFRYSGEPGCSFLAEALTEDLNDIFSMTGGISVVQVTQDSAGLKDVYGHSLQVSALVSGRVQVADNQIRVSARLADSDGQQLWSAHFDGSLNNILELQEQLAHQIAEALRLELVLNRRGTQHPPELVECYLRALQLTVRGGLFQQPQIVSLLERCLALAPTFKPAIVALARAHTNLWFIGHGKEPQASAKNLVDTALKIAPELAESHLAAGVYAANAGDLAEAAGYLAKALKIAPAFAEAHHYLGQLQLDAGRSEEGIRRLGFANRLNASSSAAAYLALAREYALQGDLDQYEIQLANHDRIQRNNTTGRVGMAMRVALWQRDIPGVKNQLKSIQGVDEPGYQLLRELGAGALSRVSAINYHSSMMSLLSSTMSPRMKALVSQIGCEALCFRKRADLGLGLLINSTALVDLSWLDRCPVIDVLRDDVQFVQVRAQAAQRAAAIWDFSS